MSKLSKYQTVIVCILTFSLILIDQAIKIAVKTGMYLHESIRVTDWFYILFTENPGMAFGMEYLNKYFLTTFRIAAVIFLVVYVVRKIRSGVCQTGYLVCLSMIIAGAAGNIFDCMFYGLMFNSPVPPMTAEFVDFGHGYDGLMVGKVVDMFYFPIIDIERMPSWIPFWGDRHFVFFSPIFNFADAAISCGMAALLLFYSKEVRFAMDSSSGKKDQEANG